MTDGSAARIRKDVDALCAIRPDRFPGGEGNRTAVAYVRGRLEELGVDVETLTFPTVEWVRGGASLRAAGMDIVTHPGPFSPPAEVEAPILAIDSTEALAGLGDRARGAILLVHGALAAEQLTPRDYPWYSNPGHVAILDAIEAAAPSAVVAATDRCDMAAALSPFPWIEDPAFGLPSAYVARSDGERLMAAAAERSTSARLRIDSHTRPAGSEQVVGSLAGDHRHVLVCAHVDGKPDTPAALDNAAGVATMLAVAADLAKDPPAATVEFVPFNGEDHATSPGEVAYLDAHPVTPDMVLVVNIDAAGLVGGRSAVSLYNASDSLVDAVDAALAQTVDVIRGPEWFASDHAVFAMRGVPALAVTSEDFARLNREVDHTPADIPGLVDEVLLASTAATLATIIRSVAR